MTSSGSTVTHEGCFRGSRYCIGKQIKKGTTLNKEKIQHKPKNVPGQPLAFPRGARGDLRGGAPGQRREKARGKAGKIRTRAKRAAPTLPRLGGRDAPGGGQAKNPDSPFLVVEVPEAPEELLPLGLVRLRVLVQQRGHGVGAGGAGGGARGRPKGGTRLRRPCPLGAGGFTGLSRRRGRPG